MKRKVLLRADGDSNIGLGHIHRIYALAQMLKEHFECSFFLQSPSQNTYQLFEKEFEVTCLPASSYNTQKFYNELLNYIEKEDIVVLDGYHFNTEYQRRVKRKAYKLVNIDDVHNVHFLSDVVINHSGGVAESEYDTEKNCRLYLGPPYCLIKRPFLIAPKRINEIVFPPNILLNFGGSDPQNYTYTILKEVLTLNLTFNRLDIVVGSAYLHLESLNSLLDKIRNTNITLYRNSTVDEILSLMKISNVAILSPSTVLFEYCSIGGLVFLQQTASNQKNVYKYFISEKMALPFAKISNALRSASDFESVFPGILKEQSIVFDQKSGERILSIFSNL